MSRQQILPDLWNGLKFERPISCESGIAEVCHCSTGRSSSRHDTLNVHLKTPLRRGDDAALDGGGPHSGPHAGALILAVVAVAVLDVEGVPDSPWRREPCHVWLMALAVSSWGCPGGMEH